MSQVIKVFFTFLLTCGCGSFPLLSSSDEGSPHGIIINSKKHPRIGWDYEVLRSLVKSSSVSMPAMIVDLDILDSNVR